jgi:hypothetical protein
MIVVAAGRSVSFYHKYYFTSRVNETLSEFIHFQLFYFINSL